MYVTYNNARATWQTAMCHHVYDVRNELHLHALV